MKIIQTPGATPLEHEELEGLLPRTITTHEELNAAEAANILEADTWLNRRKRKLSNVLQIDFLIQLHKKMFSKTWKWAGQFRKTNKNIGCDKAYIVEELKKNPDLKMPDRGLPTNPTHKSSHSSICKPAYDRFHE